MTTLFSEAVDLDGARARLDELGSARSTDAVAERADLLRVLGRLDEALAAAEESYRLAHFTGDREQVTAARLRRARVFQAQGKLDRALTDVAACRLSARTEQWDQLEGMAMQQQAVILLDLHRLDDARLTISDLIELRVAQRVPASQLSELHEAIETIMRRILVEPPTA